MNKFIFLSCTLMFFSCAQDNTIVPDHVLSADQKHNKFSKLIPPVLRAKSGDVIKADAYEASDNQLHRNATLDDLHKYRLWPNPCYDRSSLHRGS